MNVRLCNIHSSFCIENRLRHVRVCVCVCLYMMVDMIIQSVEVTPKVLLSFCVKILCGWLCALFALFSRLKSLSKVLSLVFFILRVDWNVHTHKYQLLGPNVFVMAE